jgi:hypothetical protein
MDDSQNGKPAIPAEVNRIKERLENRSDISLFRAG